MAKRIPKSFIDDLIGRTDIVSLIGSKISYAKRTGDNHMACCPFHNEKTPSFSVSQSKQFYYCFGCGVSGDALRFVMEYEHLTFIEAVESLASYNGLQVIYEDDGAQTDPEEKIRLELGLQCLTEASAYYHQCLFSEMGAEARAYLHQRKVKKSAVEKFEIGFAPAVSSIENFFGNKYPLPLLEDVGLVRNKEGRQYDWFRNRLIFPIRNARGQVIGFGGRTMLQDVQPKYLNSPETDWFNKRNELYGLYNALQSRHNSLIINEGYMDVVKMHQYGFDNTVASLGTAFGETHLKQLKKRTQQIFFCFDGDAAGLNAAEKALKIVFSDFDEAHEYRFTFMPEGEDPDSLLDLRGSEGFRQYLDSSLIPSKFLEKILDIDNREQWTVEKRAKMTQVASIWLGLLPEGNYRQFLQQDLEKKISSNVVIRANPNPYSWEKQEDNDTRFGLSKSKMANTPIKMEWRMLALLIAYPNLQAKITGQMLKKAIFETMPVLYDLSYLLHCGANPSLLRGVVREAGLEDEVLRAEALLEVMDENQQQQEFIDVLAQLEQRALEKLKRLEKLGKHPN